MNLKNWRILCAKIESVMWYDYAEPSITIPCLNDVMSLDETVGAINESKNRKANSDDRMLTGCFK